MLPGLLLWQNLPDSSALASPSFYLQVVLSAPVYQQALLPVPVGLHSSFPDILAALAFYQALRSLCIPDIMYLRHLSASAIPQSPNHTG